MQFTSANEHYWSTVVDALCCIYNYKDAADDEEEYRIRFEEFNDAVASARSAYYYCGVSRRIPFGMDQEHDMDEFFHLMLMCPDHLDACYQQALDAYDNEGAAVPLRLL